MPNQPIVFISCGQFTEEEKKLGAEICGLVEKLTPFKPYFAEYQTSLEGLTKNILGALNEAVGLVAVLHPRGTVTYTSGESRIRAPFGSNKKLLLRRLFRKLVGVVYRQQLLCMSW